MYCGLLPALDGFDTLEEPGLWAAEVLEICRPICPLAIDISYNIPSMSSGGPDICAGGKVFWNILEVRLVVVEVRCCVEHTWREMFGRYTHKYGNRCLKRWTGMRE